MKDEIKVGDMVVPKHVLTTHTTHIPRKVTYVNKYSGVLVLEGSTLRMRLSSFEKVKEDTKFNAFRPVQTRSGNPAKILMRGDYKGEGGESIVAVINNPDGTQSVYDYHENGRLYQNSTNDDDLVNIREKHSGKIYINVNKQDSGPLHFRKHDTRTGADMQASRHRIACLELDLNFTEGEGLE